MATNVVKKPDTRKALRQRVSPEEWRNLNQIYAHASAAGVADRGVAHPADKAAPDMNCAETFAQIQLLAPDQVARPLRNAPGEIEDAAPCRNQPEMAEDPW